MVTLFVGISCLAIGGLVGRFVVPYFWKPKV